MASAIKHHAAQHFVAQSYTKAWCDPSAPKSAKSEPYVWTFDKDGENPKRKAPKNLFTENDIYTVHEEDGKRNLYLEHGLSRYEDAFTRVRKLKFKKGLWPTMEEMVSVMMFVATAKMRTPGFRDFQRKQWGGIRARMEEMQGTIDRLNAEGRPPQVDRVLRGSTDGDSLDMEDVRGIEAYPIQSIIASATKTVVPMLMNMSCAVLCTEDVVGFVTTDQPCTWHNPNGHRLPPFYRAPGLGMKDIEVTLPISPRQCLLVSHHEGLGGYLDAPDQVVEELNHRHIAHAKEKFVSCSAEIRPAWFLRYPMPEDSWENERARKIASGEIKDE